MNAAVRAVVDTPVIEVVTVGERGPEGPQGPAGTGSGDSVSKIAGEAVSAYRAVVPSGADNVLLANNTDPTHRNMVCGITTQAAVLNDPVNVQRAGEIEFAGWSWTPGGLIFVGVTGHLTQTPPVAPAFSQAIAVALTTIKIEIRRREVVQLA